MYSKAELNKFACTCVQIGKQKLVAELKAKRKTTFAPRLRRLTAYPLGGASPGMLQIWVAIPMLPTERATASASAFTSPKLRPAAAAAPAIYIHEMKGDKT